MLLRKPFAFLIKHFKAIHFSLTVMSLYLILKTNSIFQFVGEYMSTNISTIGTNITSVLFHPAIIAVIIGILVLTFIILGLMSFKKKPVRFYIFNILVYSFVTFVFIYSYTNLKVLETRLLDMRTLKLIQDLSLFSLLFQSISVITVGMRATGFNIKKFDFDQDIEELKITAEDSEEFEIDVELDTDQLKRSLRKKIRHAKYVYVENKFIIHMFVLLFIALVCLIVYLNVGVYHKVYKQNEPFTTTEFMLNIKDSYITTNDYHNRPLADEVLVVRFDIRTVYPVNKKTLNTGRISLNADGYIINATDVYKDSLYDLGTTYRNEYITTDFEEYILTYVLPKGVKKKNLKLQYRDTNDKIVTIEINPIDDQIKTIYDSYLLEQKISLSKSVLSDSTIEIDSYEIGDVFTNHYTQCVNGVCMDGIEYIRPTIGGNQEKTLLKLIGSFTLDETSKNTHLSDLYTVLRDFGSIIYEINGESKTYSNLKQVKATRKVEENTYYIEVPKELETAEHIIISFTFRNFVYQIIVK